LRESVASVAATNLCARRHAAAEPLNIIFTWFRHCINYNCVRVAFEINCQTSLYSKIELPSLQHGG
jgi:hypothetical protein